MNYDRAKVKVLNILKAGDIPAYVEFIDMQTTKKKILTIEHFFNRYGIDNSESVVGKKAEK